MNSPNQIYYLKTSDYYRTRVTILNSLGIYYCMQFTEFSGCPLVNLLETPLFAQCWALGQNAQFLAGFNAIF